MIQLYCPKCGRQLNISDEYAGKSGKCQGCGTRIQVPEGESSKTQPTRTMPKVERRYSLEPVNKHAWDYSFTGEAGWSHTTKIQSPCEIVFFYGRSPVLRTNIVRRGVQLLAFLLAFSTIFLAGYGILIVLTVIGVNLKLLSLLAMGIALMSWSLGHPIALKYATYLSEIDLGTADNIDIDIPVKQIRINCTIDGKKTNICVSCKYEFDALARQLKMQRQKTVQDSHSTAMPSAAETQECSAVGNTQYEEAASQAELKPTHEHVNTTPRTVFAKTRYFAVTILIYSSLVLILFLSVFKFIDMLWAIAGIGVIAAFANTTFAKNLLTRKSMFIFGVIVGALFIVLKVLLNQIPLAAEAGNTAAQDFLGSCYRDGLFVPQDHEKAAYWFLKAAEQGVANAQNDIGNCYYYGKGLSKDKGKAVEWWTKAAEQGIVYSQTSLAKCYLEGDGVGQDYNEAVKWLRKAVEQKDYQALFMLASCYFGGKGIPKDYDEGMRLLKESADQGFQPASVIVNSYNAQDGSISDDGKREIAAWIEKQGLQILSTNIDENTGGADTIFYSDGFINLLKGDTKEAMRFFQKAAELGHTEAQYALGIGYATGEGIEEDKKEAARWLLKAAEQGFVDAQRDLGRLLIDDDPEKAVHWFRMAADQGNPEAQVSLGFVYSSGYGVLEDNEEAVKWFRLAAEKGNAEAQYYLGDCYTNGYGVEKDEKEAMKWFRLAAEQGNADAETRIEEISVISEVRIAAEKGDADAQYTLGERYYSGDGVPEDNEEAVKWFRLAAEKGNAEAQYYLGDCYTNGYGVEKDEKEAIKWFRLAAEQGHEAALEMLEEDE